MRHEDFNMKEHGFVGHLAEPDGGSDRAVIVIMGGEQTILPGIKFAERFADYGITGLAVSLFGEEGLPRYNKDVKVIVYSHGSHLNGLMPNRAREKNFTG
jgi:phosphoribosylaminoimidazole (AIR) synthetase